MMNKKAISPLVATFLLVVFALIIGTVAMNWGKNYVGGVSKQQTGEETLEETITINPDDVDTPLKKLQVEYITGKISEEEYVEKQKELTK